MIYRRASLRLRQSRAQLRVEITEFLLSQPSASTTTIAQYLNESIASIRAQILILQQIRVIRRVAVLEDHDCPDPYFWNCLWELTEHGRYHLHNAETFHCRGCQIRRQTETGMMT